MSCAFDVSTSAALLKVPSEPSCTTAEIDGCCVCGDVRKKQRRKPSNLKGWDDGETENIVFEREVSTSRRRKTDYGNCGVREFIFRHNEEPSLYIRQYREHHSSVTKSIRHRAPAKKSYVLHTQHEIDHTSTVKAASASLTR